MSLTSQAGARCLQVPSPPFTAGAKFKAGLSDILLALGTGRPVAARRGRHVEVEVDCDGQCGQVLAEVFVVRQAGHEAE